VLKLNRLKESEMKKLIFLMLALLLANASTAAEHDHDHDHKNDKDSLVKEGMMMSHNHMEKMHEHMKKMKSILSALKKEKDIDKRHQLLMSHAESMKSGMQIITEREQERDLKMKHLSPKEMEERMTMMEDHINMMQMMMEQMFEHSIENAKKPEHNH